MEGFLHFFSCFNYRCCKSEYTIVWSGLGSQRIKNVKKKTAGWAEGKDCFLNIYDSDLV